MVLRIFTEKFTMSNMVLPFIGFTLIAWIIFNRRKLYLSYKYPKSRIFRFFPALGHLGLLAYSMPSMKNFMELMTLLGTESGRMILLPGFSSITLYKVEHLDVVLTHPNTQKKHYSYDFFKGFVGDTIFRIHGKRWKENRKAMSPTMHSESIAPYAEDMNRITNILVEIFKEKVGNTFDIMPDVAKCVMDVFVNTSFGVDMQLQRGNANKFDHYTDVYLEQSMYRMMSLPTHPEFIYKMTKAYQIQEEALEYGRKVTDKIFMDRKAIYNEELENRKMEASLEEQINGRKRKIIDHLLDLSQVKLITEQEVMDEVNTFMIAGFDTCTSGVCFTLLALGMYPDIQDKVHQEVMDVLGPDRNVEYADLSKLVYLEQVIKESLRIFPPIPAILRVAEKEFLLDGNVVPEGTQLVCNVLSTHRSPLYWKDPLKFDPERFNSASEAKHVKNSFIPFLAGPRTCFGTRVAWLTLKVVIATLMRRYQVFTPYRSPEDVKLAVKMTLKAEEGILMRLEERKQR